MKRVTVVMMVLLVAVSAGASNEWEFLSSEFPSGESYISAILYAEEYRGVPFAPLLIIGFAPSQGYWVNVWLGGKRLVNDWISALFEVGGEPSEWQVSVDETVVKLASPDEFLSSIRPVHPGRVWLSVLAADGTFIGAVWDVSAIRVVLNALKAIH